MAYARMERGGGQMPLECDAEHIVDCFTGKSSNPWPHVGQRHVKERIVRCRDCKHARVLRPINPITGIPTGIEYWQCGCFWDADDELPAGVEPDGFCAWGCRKQ